MGSRVWRKILSCVVASTMFLYWSVVIAQWVGARWANHCGDGILRVDLWEMCDDGNYHDGDWCSHNCEIEWVAVDTLPETPLYDIDRVSETTTYKVFMHGKFSHTVEIQNGSEVCDYGVDNGVLCEPGYWWTCYFCTTSCTLEEVEGSSCGDWIVHHMFEECDDGNLNAWDWCSPTCTKENVLIVLPSNTSQEWITDVVGHIEDAPVIHDLMPEVEQEKVEVVIEKEEVVVPTIVVDPTPEVVEVKKVNEVVVVSWPVDDSPVVMTPLVLETPAEVVSVVTIDLDEEVNEVDSTYLPEQMNFRQNMIVRTSPVHSWIWITEPYPENLSQTWASLHIPSHVIFMWLVSFMLTVYTGSYFFTKNI